MTLNELITIINRIPKGIEPDEVDLVIEIVSNELPRMKVIDREEGYDIYRIGFEQVYEPDGNFNCGILKISMRI